MRNVVYKIFVITFIIINPTLAQTDNPIFGICDNGCDPTNPDDQLTVNWINANFNNNTTPEIIVSNPQGDSGRWIRYSSISGIYWLEPGSASSGNGSDSGNNGSSGTGSGSGGGENGSGGSPGGGFMFPGGGSGGGGSGAACPGGVTSHCDSDGCTVTCHQN